MALRVSRVDASPVTMSVQPLEWTIASDVMAIDPVVSGVICLCDAAGFSARHCRFNVPIALTEALSNAIMCGNHNDVTRSVRVRSDVQFVSERATLTIEITDEGDGFDIETAGGTPDATDWLEREEGRGIFLMRSLMDRVECARESGSPGNTVRLVLHRT